MTGIWLPEGGRTVQPLRVRGPQGPWEPVLADLAAAGWAVLYADVNDWIPPDGADPRLLGRDWDRYTAMRSPAVKSRFAATRSLLKHAAAAVLRSAPETLELAYSAFGRPSLRGCDQVDISLSHTDDFLLVGLTTRGRIGVDAELADRPLLRDGAEHHICTPYEIATLARIPAPARNRAAVHLWTLKEAYSKAIGQGMRFRFTEFGFGDDGRPVRVQRPDGTPGTGTEWSFATFRTGLRYTVSAAVYDDGFGVTGDTAAATMLDPGLVAAVRAGTAR